MSDRDGASGPLHTGFWRGAIPPSITRMVWKTSLGKELLYYTSIARKLCFLTVDLAIG